MNNLTLNSPNTQYWLNNSAMPKTQSMAIRAVSTPQNESEYDKATNAIGIAGLLKLAHWGISQLSNVCANALMRGKEFTTADKVKDIATQMKKDNGLRANIHYIDNTNKSILQNNFPQLAKELDVVANGQNAFYTNQGNFVVAPKSKPSLILHELGHATNFEKSSIMRNLQKLRIAGAYAPMVVAFLNRSTGESGDGKKNFIERNAGIIGFSAMLPTIIEEGAASIRGINAAKKALGTNANLGALKKNYFLAWLTYLLAGVGVGIATKLAVTQDGN